MAGDRNAAVVDLRDNTGAGGRDATVAGSVGDAAVAGGAGTPIAAGGRSEFDSGDTAGAEPGAAAGG